MDRSRHDKKHYETHRQQIIDRVKADAATRKVINNERLNRYLEQHPCVDCGEDDIEVLDCDHVRGEKVGNIVDLIHKRRFSWKRIEEELAKCEVRCANCHRRKTNRQFGYGRRPVKNREGYTAAHARVMDDTRALGTGELKAL